MNKNKTITCIMMLAWMIIMFWWQFLEESGLDKEPNIQLSLEQNNINCWCKTFKYKKIYRVHDYHGADWYIGFREEPCARNYPEVFAVNFNYILCKHYQGEEFTVFVTGEFSQSHKGNMTKELASTQGYRHGIKQDEVNELFHYIRIRAMDDLDIKYAPHTHNEWDYRPLG